MLYQQRMEEIRESFVDPLRNGTEVLIDAIVPLIRAGEARKTQEPYLGRRGIGDYEYKAASQATLSERGANSQAVGRDLLDIVEGMTLWGHARSQANVIPPATLASIAANTLSAIYSPNIVWDEYGQRWAMAELEAIAITADMLGLDPAKARGVFTFGGTATVLYALRVAIEKACSRFSPQSLCRAMDHGVRMRDLVVFTSEHSHGCVERVAGWLGLGTQSVVRIPGDDHFEMRTDLLELAARKAVDPAFNRDLSTELGAQADRFLGRKPRLVAIVCVAGSTDHFAIDPLGEVVAIRNRLAAEFDFGPFAPHIHADAVIGWAWSVFRDYFGDKHAKNDPLEFRLAGKDVLNDLHCVAERIRELELVDSVGVDFHKTGFTSCVSSAVLFANQSSSRTEDVCSNDLDLLKREIRETPYLFQFGDYHPGDFTLECSRSGAPVLSALANLKLLGRDGFQCLLGSRVEVRRHFCALLMEIPQIVVMNADNHGTVTLFRVLPDGETTGDAADERDDILQADQVLIRNAFNICVDRILREQAAQGDGVLLSRTDCCCLTTYNDPVLDTRLPIVSLKSYILSPFVDRDTMATVVDLIQEASRLVTPHDLQMTLQHYLTSHFSYCRNRVQERMRNHGQRPWYQEGPSEGAVGVR